MSVIMLQTAIVYRHAARHDIEKNDTTLLRNKACKFGMIRVFY